MDVVRKTFHRQLKCHPSKDEGDIFVVYRDADGDLIEIADQDDFESAMEYVEEGSKSLPGESITFRLFVRKTGEEDYPTEYGNTNCLLSSSVIAPSFGGGMS